MSLSNTALLIIDMQRDFCDPSGYAAQVGMNVGLLREPVEKIQKLRELARRLGVRIIFTREGHRSEQWDCHPSKRLRSRHAGASIGQRGPFGRFLIRGEFGHDIIDDLKPMEDELVIDKPGYGSFYQTDLELVLRSNDVDELIITGVTTDICVHSTLREAVDRGFNCTTVSDACAASDPELHNAALKTIEGEGGILGKVSSTEQVLNVWLTLAEGS